MAVAAAHTINLSSLNGRFLSSEHYENMYGGFEQYTWQRYVGFKVFLRSIHQR